MPEWPIPQEDQTEQNKRMEEFFERVKRLEEKEQERDQEDAARKDARMKLIEEWIWHANLFL
jgi:proline dehydrogenase